MVIVMKQGAGKEALAEVKKRIKELGYKPHVIHGTTRDVVGAVGDERGKSVLQALESRPGVESVVPILKPYKLASSEVHPERSVVEIAPGITVGGHDLTIHVEVPFYDKTARGERAQSVGVTVCGAQTGCILYRTPCSVKDRVCLGTRGSLRGFWRESIR